jgi:hypothetical protein
MLDLVLLQIKGCRYKIWERICFWILLTKMSPFRINWIIVCYRCDGNKTELREMKTERALDLPKYAAIKATNLGNIRPICRSLMRKIKNATVKFQYHSGKMDFSTLMHDIVTFILLGIVMILQRTWTWELQKLWMTMHSSSSNSL